MSNLSDVSSQLFFPNKIVQVDGEERSPDDYFEKIKNSKYSLIAKNELIQKILEKYSLKDKYIVERIKKCIPNGLNDYYSIEDHEFEALRKEFKGIWDLSFFNS